ncbi:hypothetical protein T4B_9023 [Trichinella pseudospiralis]|uniref:Uncharacterized protein n=1 Tax=Trichinella pseudospiralis TaxID=6337 RepID=A0A0V1G9J9_TRIPS|nr:hypothetical protein T4B_9023 [Trichinella pseudospiralis]
MQTLPCSLGRCAGSLVFSLVPRGGEIVRFACPTE